MTTLEIRGGPVVTATPVMVERAIQEADSTAQASLIPFSEALLRSARITQEKGYHYVSETGESVWGKFGQISVYADTEAPVASVHCYTDPDGTHIIGYSNSEQMPVPEVIINLLRTSFIYAASNEANKFGADNAFVALLRSFEHPTQVSFHLA